MPLLILQRNLMWIAASTPLRISFKTNIVGTQVLLDAARERGVRLFLQVSTDEVMGSLPEDENAYFTEASPLAPNNPYAASKAAAEHLVRRPITHGLHTIITRCGNNYGPRQFPEKLIPLALSTRCVMKPFQFMAMARTCAIGFLSRTTAAQFCWRSRKAALVPYTTLGRATSNAILTLSLRCFVSWKNRVHSCALFQTGRGTIAGMQLIETELGWRPLETWESGLRKTIDWYAANSEWIERARSGAYRDFYKQHGTEVGA